MKKGIFYAVHRGKKRGVFDNWKDAQYSVAGYDNAKFRKFKNRQDAEYFAEYGKEPSFRQSEGTRIQNKRKFNFFKSADERKVEESALKAARDAAMQAAAEQTVQDGKEIYSFHGYSKFMPLNLEFDKNSECIFTDGSCILDQRHKPVACGYGIWFGDVDPRNKAVSLNHEKLRTSQRAELSAILDTLRMILDDENKIKEIYPMDFQGYLKKRNIISDSEYSVNLITRWAKKWERNGWKKSDGKLASNLDLIKPIYKLTKQIETPINYLHIKQFNIKSHKTPEPDKRNDPFRWFVWNGNSQADELANQGAKN